MTSRIEYNNPTPKGSFGLPYHYEMVSDIKKIEAFRAAINATCRDKIVLESGTGSGLLSLLAARAGARKVYAVEIDHSTAAMAARNIKNSGMSTVRVLQKDMLNVTTDDLDGDVPDVVIAENLSTWLVTEPELEIMNQINRKIARPDTIRIPSKIRNMVELGNAQFVFENCVEVRSFYFLFSGIALPRIMSNRTLFQELDLGKVNSTVVNSVVDIKATETGTVNCIRLTSPLILHEEIFFESSDTLMPPVVVPLNEDVYVKNGDTLSLRIHYSTNTSWDEFYCSGQVML